MRIAMMQMAMTEDMERNLQVSYEAVKEAAGVDLLFFPEVQHMPFLPQYTADELPDYLPAILELCAAVPVKETSRILQYARHKLELLRERFIEGRLAYAFLLDIVLTITGGLEGETA